MSRSEAFDLRTAVPSVSVDIVKLFQVAKGVDLVEVAFAEETFYFDARALRRAAALPARLRKTFKACVVEAEGPNPGRLEIRWGTAGRLRFLTQPPFAVVTCRMYRRCTGRGRLVCDSSGHKIKKPRAAKIGVYGFAGTTPTLEVGSTQPSGSPKGSKP